MAAMNESSTWERWISYVQFVMLGLASVVAASTANIFGVDSPGWLLTQVALITAAASWSVWWVILRPGWGRRPLHFAVRAALAFVMTWINPFFGIYAWVGYLDLDAFRTRWSRRIGVLAVAVTLAGSQSGGLPPAGATQWLLFGVLLIVNVGLAMLLDQLQAQNIRRSNEQASMIAELERVNEDLERAARENAALHQTVVAQARRAGTQDERQRLAREIHDTIAQSLAATLAQLQAAQGEADPQARLSRATDLVRSALREARRSVLDLAPTPLMSATLVDAVSRLVEDWALDHPLEAEVVAAGEARALHPEVEATVLRIAQEALANVTKHANATRVAVTLTYNEEQIALDVRDDGVGFDPASLATPSSFGLRGMRQRAARLAGALNVETGTGNGTAVSVHLPALPREAA